jgi:integrase
MKATRFQVKFDESHKSYRLNIPAKFSDTGARSQKFYPTKKEADTVANQMRARVANFGLLAGRLSPIQVAEAAEAFAVLKSLNVSLLSVAKEFAATHALRNGSVTLKDLIERFIASKDKIPEKRKNELWHTINLFDPSMKIVDVSADLIEATFFDQTPGAKDANFRKLRAILNFAVKKELLVKNPMDAMERPKVDKKEVFICDPATVEALFADAVANNDPEMVAFLTFSFFCGIRPGEEGELRKLDWADVNGKSVLVRAGKAKASRARPIPLQPNAQAWLQKYEAMGGKREGLVVKRTEKQVELARSRNWKAAGFEQIPQDAGRHSFATYRWLATDMPTVLKETGHSERVFRSHYHGFVEEGWTEKFWSIMPKGL